MKYKYLLYLTFLVTNLAHTGQAQNLAWQLKPSQDYIAVKPFSEGYALVQTRSHQSWVFMNKKGHFSTDRFVKAYPFSDGMAAVFDGKSWRYRNSVGQLSNGQYEDAFDFEDGIAVVKIGKEWSPLNQSGAIGKRYDALRPFGNQWAGAKKGHKTMIINYLGDSISLPAYDFVHTFSEGLAAVMTAKGEWAYIDTTGKTVIETQKGRKYASAFFNGLAAVCDNEQDLSFIDKQGKVLFSFKNSIDVSANPNRIYNIYQHQFSNGLAAVKQAGKWGYIDTLGAWAIPAQYEWVTLFSEGFAAVKQDGKWLFINTTGEIAQKGAFKAAKPCTEGVAWVQTEAGWGLLRIADKLNILLESPFKAKQDTVKIHFSSKYRFDSIRLECNGKWIKTDFFAASDVFDHSDAWILTKGKTALKWTASAGKQVETHESLFYYEPSNAEIQYAAVLVANRRYKIWEALSNNAIQAADSLAAVLYQKYQFTRIEVLHDAHLEQMQTTFSGLKEHVAGERLFIFYAGHGDYKKGTDVYLIPVDAEVSNRKTQLSAALFLHYMTQWRVKHVLFVVDACFGGSFLINDVVPLGALRGNHQVDKITEEPAITNDEKLASRVGMSSGQVIFVPDESEFAKQLLINLLANQKELLWANDLLGQVKQAMNKNISNGLVPQFGKLGKVGHKGGNFVFRKKLD